MVKEYLATHHRPEVAAALEDVSFREYMDEVEVSLTPSMPFVMHGLWRKTNQWKKSLQAEIEGLVIQVQDPAGTARLKKMRALVQGVPGEVDQ